MNKDSRKLKIGLAYVLLMLLCCVISLSSATYAWFTANSTVSTNSVSIRSGGEHVTLELSANGTKFGSDDGVPITQVNKGMDVQNLLPVSTADLNTFVYSPFTQGDSGKEAHKFVKVENEEYYYHGRIYIKTDAEGEVEGKQLALYLDSEADLGSFVNSDYNEVLNAARLGLKIADETHIFYLSDGSNESGKQIRNTYVNGQLVGDGNVLDMSSGTIKVVEDPAVPLSRYEIQSVDDLVELPEEPLCYLEMNETYVVDIYFYLEGCDPDCSDTISFEDFSLNLAFYGVLVYN